MNARLAGPYAAAVCTVLVVSGCGGRAGHARVQATAEPVPTQRPFPSLAMGLNEPDAAHLLTLDCVQAGAALECSGLVVWAMRTSNGECWIRADPEKNLRLERTATDQWRGVFPGRYCPSSTATFVLERTYPVGTVLTVSFEQMRPPSDEFEKLCSENQPATRVYRTADVGEPTSFGCTRVELLP